MSVRRLVASSSCWGRAVSDGWVTRRSGGGGFGPISEGNISDVHQYMLSRSVAAHTLVTWLLLWRDCLCSLQPSSEVHLAANSKLEGRGDEDETTEWKRGE